MGREPGEIISIAFLEAEGYAVITFADGASESRKCSLRDATELAGAAGLPIALAQGDLFRWEQIDRPTGSEN